MSIKELRERAGVTQEQLALRMDVSQGAVSRWESGKTAPQSKLHKKLVRTLGCTVDELLSAIEEGKRNREKVS